MMERSEVSNIMLRRRLYNPADWSPALFLPCGLRRVAPRLGPYSSLYYRSIHVPTFDPDGGLTRWSVVPGGVR